MIPDPCRAEAEEEKSQIIPEKIRGCGASPGVDLRLDFRRVFGAAEGLEEGVAG
jgi:hypothetical protein